MVLVAIVACEIAFWVFLAAGLVARYVLRSPRLGVALLLGSPLVDAVLLALTAVDLHHGAPPTSAHALAATYLGVTVAFGPSIMTWADARFAHRVAGRTAPIEPPRGRPQRMAHEWREFGRAGVAWAITCTILLGLAALVDDADRAGVLLGHLATLSVVLAIWLITGPLPATIGVLRDQRRAP